MRYWIESDVVGELIPDPPEQWLREHAIHDVDVLYTTCNRINVDDLLYTWALSCGHLVYTFGERPEYCNKCGGTVNG